MKNEFSKRVIKLALTVPKGKVTTYGRIARAAGGGGQAARSITAILGKAYEQGETTIPFHRIVYSDGSIYKELSLNSSRMKLYQKENIKINKKSKIENFNKVLWEFK